MTESYDSLAKRINESYKRTRDVSDTAKELGVSRLIVLEALGFSDEWEFRFED